MFGAEAGGVAGRTVLGVVFYVRGPEAAAGQHFSQILTLRLILCAIFCVCNFSAEEEDWQ